MRCTLVAVITTFTAVSGTDDPANCTVADYRGLQTVSGVTVSQCLLDNAYNLTLCLAGTHASVDCIWRIWDAGQSKRDSCYSDCLDFPDSPYCFTCETGARMIGAAVEAPRSPIGRAACSAADLAVIADMDPQEVETCADGNRSLAGPCVSNTTEAKCNQCVQRRSARSIQRCNATCFADQTDQLCVGCLQIDLMGGMIHCAVSGVAMAHDVSLLALVSIIALVALV